MPTELYNALSTEKKELILDAAFNEFSRYPFEYSSINQIVKTSGISRGSFYLYFKDKLDIYLYTIQKVLKQQSQQFIRDVNPDGDIFNFYRALFEYNLELIASPKYGSFFENLFLSLNYNVLVFLRSTQRTLKESLFKDISKSTLQETKNNGFESLSRLLEMVNRELITRKIAEDISDETIIGLYDQFLVYIQIPKES